MPNYIVDCKSGIKAVVSGKDLAEAQSSWESDLEAGWAVPGNVRDPLPGEVERILQDHPEHDYR